MNRWEQSLDICNLAADLGVRDAAPLDGILDFCRGRIDRWVAEAGGVTDIDALESLVTRQLQMVIEEVRSDEDWDRLTEVYARGKKEGVFATMQMRFDDTADLTYGALVQRRKAGEDDLDRFVAVVDCRGHKLARRFFTRWHEIAHRMTTHCDLPEPVFRSEQDPIERLMDEIAGHVGFYEPLFQPAFQQARAGKKYLTFGTVTAIKDTAFPAASFQSTLFACIRRTTTPVVYAEATLAHKKEVKRKLATPSLFGEEPLPGELRAVKVVQNKAAEAGRFNIPTNMRVPVGSLIHQLFEAEPLTDGCGEENLNQWVSRGRSLEGCPVVVEGRKVPGRVVAILQPVEAG